MPTPDEKAPSRVHRVARFFSHTDPETGEEVTVHNDNLHRILAEASDAELTELANQGLIELTHPLEG